MLHVTEARMENDRNQYLLDEEVVAQVPGNALSEDHADAINVTFLEQHFLQEEADELFQLVQVFLLLRLTHHVAEGASSCANQLARDWPTHLEHLVYVRELAGANELLLAQSPHEVQMRVKRL